MHSYSATLLLLTFDCPSAAQLVTRAYKFACITPRVFWVALAAFRLFNYFQNLSPPFCSFVLDYPPNIPYLKIPIILKTQNACPCHLFCNSWGLIWILVDGLLSRSGDGCPVCRNIDTIGYNGVCISADGMSVTIVTRWPVDQDLNQAVMSVLLNAFWDSASSYPNPVKKNMKICFSSWSSSWMFAESRVVTVVTIFFSM